MEQFLFNSLVLQAMNGILCSDNAHIPKEELCLKAFAIADEFQKEFKRREDEILAASTKQE